MNSPKGYSFSQIIGQGTSCSIYEGVRQRDQAPIVAKVLDVEFATPLQLARLRHEYELLKGFDHPCVIRAFSLESVGNSLAMIMENFGGVALRHAIEEKRLDLAGKLQVALRIVDGLEAIHRAGILHKDINPNNILIDPAGSDVRIIDFGNATALASEDLQLHISDHLEGTLAYIAPEQTGRMNRPVDYRADFYSLGVTLYELLLGRRPFEANDAMELVHMHIAHTPPTLHQRDPSIPEMLSGVVGKLMEKDAEERYQSILGIRRDLEACRDALLSHKTMEPFTPGQYDVPERFVISAKLRGRDHEIRLLADAYEAACSGEPGLLLVTGYSGIGKSALVNEIHRPIAERPGFFISGKFDQYRRDIPYSAVIQAFGNLIRQILAGSDESIASWRERLLAALDENGKLIIEVLPELEHIIGAQPSPPPLAPREAQNRFNHYFVNFIRVFIGADHPLVLFLDDLQWADDSSLNLLERLGADQESQHLLIIGAYRSNEVDRAHPLRLALKRLEGDGLRSGEILLRELPINAALAIVKDTLRCSEEECYPLADLIYRKSAGNPFFFNQLLKNLHTDGLIAYDGARGAWSWDIGRIEKVGVSDNVAELMAANISKLPPETRRLLELAACLGNTFSLHDLSVIGEASWNETAAHLRAALDAELITPVGDEYRFFGGAEETAAEEFDVGYRFLHDRVQESAYDLLSENERKQVHFKAGDLLLRNNTDEELDEKIFDIVNHFNLAPELAVDPRLRLHLAELNLQATIKAKRSIAYRPALKYATAARGFLADMDETERLFRVLVELAECEYLNGNAKEAEAVYRQALGIAHGDDEKAFVYEAMIHHYTNSGEFRAAYDTGRLALRLFGVSLPANFTPPLFLADLLRVKWKMRGCEIEALIDLPLCEDPRAATATRLIAALQKAAYQIRPELCVASALKGVDLALRYGITELSAISFLVFGGIFIGGVTGNHEAGYHYGRLALAMNERFGNLKQRSEINFVSAYFTHFWMEPAQRTEHYYRAAYESGLQTGDFFHLSCAACTLVESQLIRGVPLPEVSTLGAEYRAFMERIESHEASGAITAVLRTVKNLAGETSAPESFGDETFDEAAFVQRIEGFTSLHFSHFYFVNKMQSLYLWGRYEEALEAARRSEAYLKYSIAMLHTAEHHFYRALILCKTFDNTGDKGLLRGARRILRKFQRWAKLNPANFEHKALLIEAETARLTRNERSAPRLYERAIASAEQHGFPQNKALANELAGRFFNSEGAAAAAGAHLQEAYYGYRIWGATGIAERLATEFPFIASRHAREIPETGLRSFPPGESGTRHEPAPHIATLCSTSTNSHGASNLDLETVIKATQAISGEIKHTTLLQKLIRIIIENAGAETGSFVRIDQGHLRVEVEGTVKQQAATLSGGKEPDPERIPVSLLQYVARVGDSVLLNDAQRDERFWNDRYIKAAKPRSILCAPVLHHGKVSGVIYLENRMTGGAFTPSRLELLNILAAQAAISLENAMLYENLEQRVEERTRELSQATEELRAANEALERLTITDALTQIFNKRHFQQVYDAEWKRATRDQTPLTVMLIDIDHFKLYNDTYGHVEGDECLRRVAGALQEVVSRPGDLLARFGGEEFAILLPNTQAENATAVAKKLVENVRAQGIPHRASLTCDRVTISLGLADTIPRRGDDPISLIDAADQALYQAKSGGRNRFHAGGDEKTGEAPDTREKQE